MTGKELKAKMHAGDTVLGTFVVSPSPFWPKAIGDCGLDFVFIDTEHISLNRETLSWMCRTYGAMGLPPLVRITRPDPDLATVALDDGATGVVAPYVETAAQATALRGAAKLRPLKGKRLEETLRGRTLEPELARYIAQRTAENLLIVNIESVPALESLDAILDVPEIDAVLIGPHDLSTSLGIPEQYNHPAFLKAAETIFRKARDRNIGAAIHAWGTVQDQVQLIELGANVLIHKADILFFKTGLTSELAEIRQRLGMTSESQDGEAVSI